MQHAKLSPSSASRWINCPASIQRCDSLGEEAESTSAYAEEGQSAHALADAIIRNEAGFISTEDAEKEIAGIKGVTDEMAEDVLPYAHYVLEQYYAVKHQGGCLFTERKFDLSKYIPGGFGTTDAVILYPGGMEVIDLKFGRGVQVSPLRNEQMMCYALGALEAYGPEYGVEHVILTICQPRIGGIASWHITAADLEKWGTEVLAPAALKADSRCDSGGNPGKHCRFCKYSPFCTEQKANADSAMASYFETEMDAIEEAHRAEVLATHYASLEVIENWCRVVREKAYAHMLAGGQIDGYKLVEGRSVRKWKSDTDANAVAEKLIALGFAEDKVFKPRTVVGIGAIEKLTGKKDFAAATAGAVVKPAGKPTIAPNEDKRKPMELESARNAMMDEALQDEE